MDIQADNISYLIQYAKGEYIVYIDGAGDLDWETTDAFENMTDDIRSKWNKAVASTCRIQNIPSVRAMPYKFRKPLFIMLGTAIANSEEESVSEQLLYEAEIYIEEREKELVRRWVCETALLMLGCVVVVVCLQFLFHLLIIDTVHDVFFGILGGCLSLLFMSRKKGS